MKNRKLWAGLGALVAMIFTICCVAGGVVNLVEIQAEEQAPLLTRFEINVAVTLWATETPTETPLPTETFTPEPTLTPTPTGTFRPESTSTPTWTAIPTATAMATATVTPIPTLRPLPPPSDHPAGATARCSDGTYSFSQNRRGTCSHHGGVARWY